jgi:hypothetical protein
MRTTTKLALATLVAVVALAAAVGAAGARRFEFSDQRFTFVTRSVGYRGGEPTNCPITLAGSFHSRTISKVSGQLVGYINSAGSGTCPEGSGRVLTESLPWHVRFASFSGTLPSITQIKLQVIGYSFLEICITSSCLYKSTAANPLILGLEVTRGVITSMRWEENNAIPRFMGEFICPAELIVEGAGEPSVTGTTTKINVRLIQ